MKQRHKPAISVIMSAYNGEKYIIESIESVLNQTFRDFEFIIINDGSTDKTLEIIKKYARIDKRIRLIDNGKNIGLIKSLNKGLEAAKGKYIARMDADDFSLPERFSIQYNLLEKNKDIFLLGSGYYIINFKGEIIGKVSREFDSVELREKLLTNNVIHHPTVMFRNLGYLFYRDKMIYCEDYDLWLRFLSERKNLFVLENCLLKYRIHEGSISSKKRRIQIAMISQAKKFYLERVKEGKESYDSFDPSDIVKKIQEINVNKENDLRIIQVLFKENKMKELRRFILENRSINQTFSKQAVYYIASYLPVNFINHLRNLIWK